MEQPEIKLLAISNVYCRLMNFKKAGDQELGHYHSYDHGTLLSVGSLRVEILDEQDNVLSEKVFTAPTFIFIRKDKKHRLTALQDNTVASCIHALRTIDEEILDPEFLVEQRELSTEAIDELSGRPTLHDPGASNQLHDLGPEIKRFAYQIEQKKTKTFKFLK